MTSDLQQFPISVVIPTRNSMDKLPRHHADFFARCAELIHCDSLSKDDTKAHPASASSTTRTVPIHHKNPPGNAF